MTASLLIRLLESELPPRKKWVHTRKSSFNKAFDALPASIQSRAVEAFRVLQADPSRTDIRRCKNNQSILRISVTTGKAGYRAAAMEDGDRLIWFWIGTHNDYDSMLKRAVR